MDKMYIDSIFSLLQPLYETWFIALYTVCYTAAPVMCVACFEQV